MFRIHHGMQLGKSYFLVQANYRKGEAFRLEGSDLLAAIYHFCECYKLVKDPNALSKAIILAVDNGKYPKISHCRSNI